MHRRGGGIDASEKQVSLESKTSGWRMQQLRTSEVGEDMERDKRAKVSTHAWRIPREKININVLKDGVEENVGVYAKEQRSIPAGMRKYIPVQTKRVIKGEV